METPSAIVIEFGCRYTREAGAALNFWFFWFKPKELGRR